MTRAEKAMIKGMTADELRTLIAKLIELMDEADQDDSFGTEGWRCRVEEFSQ